MPTSSLLNQAYLIRAQDYSLRCTEKKNNGELVG
jgi:hypothetical protein